MSSSFLDRQSNSLWVSAGRLALALCVLVPAKSEARPDVRLDYDATIFVSDNPFLLPGKDRGSGAIALTARPHFDWKLTPQTEVELATQASFRQYERHYGEFVTGLADLQLRHRHNEFLTISGEAAYEHDFVIDLLTDTPDFATDTRGIQESLRTSATANWTPSEKVSVIGNVGWRKESYPDSDLLPTSRTLAFSLGATRRLNERTNIGILSHLTSNDAANGEDTSVKSIDLTAFHQLTEDWHGEVQFGVERTKSSPLFLQAGQSRTNFNGSANICRQDALTTACLEGAVRSQISGFGQLQREYSLRGTLRSRVSESGTIIAEADYRRARLPELSAAASNIRVSANYEHRLSNSFYLMPGAAYLQRNRLAGENANAFVLQIGLLIRGEHP